MSGAYQFSESTPFKLGETHSVHQCLQLGISVAYLGTKIDVGIDHWEFEESPRVSTDAKKWSVRTLGDVLSEPSFGKATFEPVQYCRLRGIDNHTRLDKKIEELAEESLGSLQILVVMSRGSSMEVICICRHLLGDPPDVCGKG